MSNFQKILISFGAFIIIGILIYLGILWYLRSRNKMRDSKMLTMNLVIKYKLFLEYLAYQEEQKSNYVLILIKINNLRQLENTYNNQIVSSYLTKVVKELSVYLPFGGKIAQTTERDTFIMYYPVLDEDYESLGRQLKLLAEKTYFGNAISIEKTSSVALTEGNNLKGLSQALIASVRSLGEVTIYDEQVHFSSDEFISLWEQLSNLEFNLRSSKVESIKLGKKTDLYNTVFIGEFDLYTFLNKISIADQSWVNMYMLENILSKIYQENLYENISLPVLLKTIEHESFIDYLEVIVKTNQFLLDNITLSIKLSNIDNEEQLIKNILYLSNLGVKISLSLDDINQNVYNAILKYHVNRLEVNDDLLNHSLISDLLYSAKVNHLEVLLKTNNKELNEQSLNVSHITRGLVEFKEDKKRGKN